MADHFYLISNASTDVYANTLTKFTNNFGQNPLTLPDNTKYQIGLESIFIHPRFTNIPMLPLNTPHIKICTSNDFTTVTMKAIGNKPTLNPYDIPTSSTPPVVSTNSGRLIKIRNYNITQETADENYSQANADIIHEDLYKDVPFVGITLPYKHYTTPLLIETINELLLSKSTLGNDFLGFTISNNSFDFRYPSNSSDESAKQAFLMKIFQDYHILIHNELAVILGLEKEIGKEYKVFTMLTMSILKPIRLKAVLPKILKVQIDNVLPLIENDSHACVLSYHTLNMINDYLHYVQFDNPLYLTLNSSTISDFTVQLLDENNKQLQLNPSLPTIIKMSLRPLEEGTKEFNIVIDSTKKNPNYPNNTGTDFCFNLTPILQLDDDYVCSINSISYSTFFKTLPIPRSQQYIRVVRKIDGVSHALTIRFNMYNKPFFNIQDVLNVLNEDLLIPDDHPDADKFQHPALDKNCAKFVLEEIGGVSFVNVGGFPNTRYNLPHELISVLGEIDSLTETTHARWIFKLEKSTTRAGLYIRRFMHPPDIISLIPITLFIYADFIQPVMVGETQVNLLQIVPVRSEVIDGHKNKYVTEAIKRPNWAQVRMRTLDKLSFKIMRSDGKPIDFHHSKDGVIITLTFKKMTRASNHHNVMFL